VADRYPPAAQRPRLLTFAEALGCRDAALRRDECGDWRITGKHGWIYAVPGVLLAGSEKTEGFLLYYSGPEFIGSARGWGFAKRAFEAFGCTVTQDGDDEGIAFLDRLPTPAEAEIIRDKLWIAKKREMSEAELERLRSIGTPFRSRDDVADETTAEKSPSNDPPAPSWPNEAGNDPEAGSSTASEAEES
jgi:hypothetical protein